MKTTSQCTIQKKEFNQFDQLENDQLLNSEMLCVKGGGDGGDDEDDYDDGFN